MENYLHLGFYLINEYQDPFFHYGIYYNRFLILFSLPKFISEHLRGTETIKRKELDDERKSWLHNIAF